MFLRLEKISSLLFLLIFSVKASCFLTISSGRSYFVPNNIIQIIIVFESN